MKKIVYAKENVENGRYALRYINRLADRSQDFLSRQTDVCKAELLRDGVAESKIITGMESEQVVEQWIADRDASQKNYVQKRQMEYPSIEECIHAILDDELEELQAKRQAVKQKYPKG